MGGARRDSRRYPAAPKYNWSKEGSLKISSSQHGLEPSEFHFYVFRASIFLVQQKKCVACLVSPYSRMNAILAKQFDLVGFRDVGNGARLVRRCVF